MKKNLIGLSFLIAVLFIVCQWYSFADLAEAVGDNVCGKYMSKPLDDIAKFRCCMEQNPPSDTTLGYQCCVDLENVYSEGYKCCLEKGKSSGTEYDCCMDPANCPLPPLPPPPPPPPSPPPPPPPPPGCPDCPPTAVDCNIIADPKTKECCIKSDGLIALMIDQCVTDSPDPKEACSDFVSVIGSGDVTINIANSNLCCQSVNCEGPGCSAEGWQICQNIYNPPSSVTPTTPSDVTPPAPIAGASDPCAPILADTQAVYTRDDLAVLMKKYGIGIDGKATVAGFEECAVLYFCGEANCTINSVKTVRDDSGGCSL